MKNFYAVILAGGGGERLWPLSTPQYPKQFLSVFGSKPLIVQAVERLKGIVAPGNILILTGKDFVALTRKVLPNLPAANIIGEPFRRDTAAAVATACGIVENRGGVDAVCAILTADQLMKDVGAFRGVLKDAALAAARTQDIVTMGITPDRPATGFGYIERGAAINMGTKTKITAAKRFVEKPDEKTARRYLKSGKYVWNAGMFVWKVSTLKAAFEKHAPHLLTLANHVAAITRITPARLKPLYEPLPKISFDYAIMEKTSHVLVTDGAFGWDDVGSWNAAEKHLPQDTCGNVTLGDVTMLDAQSVTALSTGPKIAALGVKDLVIVVTKTSVLVTSKSRAQDLKKILEEMRNGK